MHFTVRPTNHFKCQCPFWSPAHPIRTDNFFLSCHELPVNNWFKIVCFVTVIVYLNFFHARDFITGRHKLMRLFPNKNCDFFCDFFPATKRLGFCLLGFCHGITTCNDYPSSPFIKFNNSFYTRNLDIVRFSKQKLFLFAVSIVQLHLNFFFFFNIWEY